jgi:hypothetical protein
VADIRTSVPIAAVLPFLSIVVLAAACDKAGQTRSTFEVHRAGWDRRISALKSRTSDLEQRFFGLPPLRGGGGVAAHAQRRRLQASIIGTRQTLADIESHVAESAGEIEMANSQGGGESEDVLNGVIGRVNEFVRQQEQTQAANDEALTRMGGSAEP